MFNNIIPQPISDAVRDNIPRQRVGDVPAADQHIEEDLEGDVQHACTHFQIHVATMHTK